MLHTKSSTLIVPGGSIKDLGSKKIGGYLVRFGDPDNTDLEGQFFTKDTDFGPHRQTVALYGHGFDPKLKRRKLDEQATLSVDDAGVWIEAQLAVRDEYEEMLYQEGILKNKMGWSSGTAAHLVEVEEQEGGAEWIKQWWLGLDASITPQPAEPRTLVTPLKSWRCTPVGAIGTDQATKAESLNDRIRQISSDFRSAFRDTDRDFYPYVEEVFMDTLVAEVRSRYYRVAYERGDDNRFTFAPERDWVEVVENSTWVPRSEMEDEDTLEGQSESTDAADSATNDITKTLRSVNERIEERAASTKATRQLAASLASINNRLETRHA